MKRRSFIKSCALGAAASTIPWVALRSSAQGEAAGEAPVLVVRPDAPLKIKNIEVLKAGGTYFLRTTTEDGRVGIALCEGVLKTYAPILQTFIIPYFLGKDARDIEKLVDGVYVANSNYKKAGLIFWSCVAWVEFSILDLLGQATNKSIGELFGKIYRTKLPVYQSSTDRSTTPEEEVARFERVLAERGGTAIKYKIGGRMSGNADAAPGRSEGLVKLAAKTFGPKATLYVDANSSYDAPRAIEVGRMLESYGVAWYEEPVPFEDFVSTKAVADELKIPVAGGEQDTSLPKFRWMIHNRAVDIVQPDIVYNGGFVRAKRVARLAQAAGIPTTLHSPGTGIAQIYMIHFAASTENSGPYQEYHINKEGKDEWASFQIRAKNGVVPVPTAPGKGFEIDPAFMKKAETI